MKMLLGIVILVALVGVIVVEVLRVRIMSRFTSDAVFKYEARLEKDGCRLDVTLRDGRRLSFVVDPTLVYEMSNDLLRAAGRLGAQRPLDARQPLRDPELIKMVEQNRPKAPS